MTKLIELYKGVLKKEEWWNYYDSTFLNLDLDRIDDLEYCCRFIRDYIYEAQKVFSEVEVGLNHFRTHKSIGNRPRHIVSTFLLGLALYHNDHYIYQNVNHGLKAIKAYERETLDRFFAYLWFMACLFHDLGYVYEEDTQILFMPDIYGLKFSRKKAIPSFYKGVYKTYFEYRNRKDHGIIGGALFDEKISAINEYNREHGYKDLSWSKNLLPVYHYVSNIIMAHNIWFAKCGTKNAELYQNEYNGKLKPLIIDASQSYKFKFTDFPLFTLFCIVDSIEPSKTCNNWRNVKIGLESQNIIIASNDKAYIHKVLELNEWLLPINEISKTQIEIKLD